MPGDADSIVQEFLVESHENLDQLDRDLVALEQEPESADLLASVFRTIHTIKGNCGFLGFGKLEKVAHAGESLLSKLRDGELRLQPERTTGLLSLVDAVRQMLESIEQAGHEGDADHSALISQLIALQEEERVCSDSRPASPVEPVAAAEPIPTSQAEAPHPRGATESEAAAKNVASDSRHTASGNIRVDVALLDRLMNQVGELVLARNQILQFTGALADSALVRTSQRLNLITSELQEGIMKTRMQPIETIWSKFPRIVRDLSLQCGKRVRVEMEGQETELDKTIVEAIKDPLTHLIRNAVDHGIEAPKDREAAGKSAEGCLSLRAYHEGGQVNIEVADDGAGLHLDRIRQRALERGLITADQAARLSDREAAMLIFAPGFSTAAAVTNVSGRGVGMDVVKTNVEKIGGAVDIQFRPGGGTVVRLKIPLTLAIVPALVVTCGGGRFAIPQVNLLELVRLEGEQARKGIELLHGAPVYRLRGKLLPIVYLRSELGLGAQAEVANSAEADATVNIVVLSADDRQFGLVVDKINDSEEIVVKALGKQLKGIPVYAGSAIMGDGAVALILDVLGLAHRAHVLAEGRDRNAPKGDAHSQENGSDARRRLLTMVVGDRVAAVPLSAVSRLEEIPVSRVERAGSRDVVQYRGEILPLIRLSEALGASSFLDADRPLQVVVYNERGRGVGLVVDRITDIVDAVVEASRASDEPGLLASAVVQGRVIDLLDLPAIIGRYEPGFFDASEPSKELSA